MVSCKIIVISDEPKEKGEEARYIRRAEAAKAEEIRANLERIMALEDSNNEKAQLVELLGKFLFYCN